MDENRRNYECEPVEERPVKNEPQDYRAEDPNRYGGYRDPNRVPPYSYSPYQPEKKPKKDRTSLKLFALVAAVAILGTAGGALLTTAISGLRAKEEAAQPPQAQIQEAATPAEENVPVVKEEAVLPETKPAKNNGKALSLVQVYEQTVNSVVGITTEVTTNAFGQEAVSASSGSGFILSEDGYILTNCHVVASANSIEVSLFNGDSFAAELVGSDSNFDIAVLKIKANGLPAVSVGDSDSLKVGEEVVAIGNPLGELTFTMTNGILSALDREINTDGVPQTMLQTNAAINSGNSGGPLFDMDGNVIGVTTAKYSGSTLSGTTIEGLGFAIPINIAMKVAFDLVEFGYVKDQAYLGVTVKTLDSGTASYYSLPVGPRVEAVVQGACSEKAGVQVGDIIIRFNGVDVENNAGLLAALKKVKAGDTVSMTVFRAGAELELSVTLDEKPSQDVLDAQVAEYEKSQQQTEEEYYYQYPDGFGG